MVACIGLLTLHIVLVHYLRALATQRYHARLHTHCLTLRTVEVIGAAGKLLEVDIGTARGSVGKGWNSASDRE